MIYDKMERILIYKDVIPHAQDIKDRWQQNNPNGASYEIRQKTYTTKADADRKFEVHYRTIDFMLGFSGEEYIHICPPENLQQGEDLANGADGRKLEGEV